MSGEGIKSGFLPARSSAVSKVLWVGLVAAVYFVAARLSLLLEFQPEDIAAIWPPSGVFLAAVLLARRELRPWVVGVLLVVDFVAEYLAGTPLVVSGAYAVAMAGDAVLASWLMFRLLGDPIRFRSLKEVGVWLVVSVLLSNGLWSLGAAAASEMLPGTHSFWSSWQWWATSNGVGNLLITPFVVSWAGWAGTPSRSRRGGVILEWVLLLGLSAAAQFCVFQFLSAHRLLLLFLPYATLPFLLWAALRFGVKGVSTVLVVLAGIALPYVASDRVVSFSLGPDALDDLMVLQMLLAVAAAPALLLAAVAEERRVMVEQLREAEELHRVTLLSVGDGVVSTDVQERVRLMNPVAEALTGWTNEEARGKPLAEVFHIINETSRQPVESPADRAVREGTVVGLANHTLLVARDGSERAIADSAAPIRGPRGQVLGAVLVFRDQTEERAAQVALRASDRHWQTTFDAIGDSILLLDAEYRVVKCNAATEKLFGLPREEIQGRPCYEVMHGRSEQCAGCFLEYTKQNKRRESRELRPGELVVGDRRFEVTADPLFDEEGRFLGGVHILSDITERKRAEEARARLLHILEASRNEIYVFDSESLRFEYVNGSAIRNLGYTLETLQTMTPLDLKVEFTVESFRKLVEPLIRHEQGQVPFTTVHRRADGTVYPVEARLELIEAAERRVFLAVVVDITKRKRAEDALRRSEALLNESQAVGHVGSWELDRATNRITWSDEVYRIFGLRPQEFGATYEAFLEMVYPEDRAAVGEAYAESIRTDGDTYEMEHRIVRRDNGEIRVVHEKCEHVRNASGVVIRSIGMVQDVTERKAKEEELRASEERFRRAVEEAPIPIMLHAEDGAVLQVNNSWCEISGYGREDLATMHEWTARAYPDRQAVVEEGIARLFELERRVSEGDFKVFSKWGQTLIWEFSSAPLGRLADGRRVVISMATDVTERRRLEQERWALEAQLRQQQKLEAIGTLAGGVAHEINNPVNGIMNYAQLIQDRLGPESPIARYPQEIIRETERVATIVRNLLTFARTDNQSHSPARIADIVESTLSLIRTVIRRDQITLTVNVPEDLPVLKCRSQQVQQVLMNLMTNARDALNERFPGHDPSKILSLSARVFEREGRRWIRLTVEDHGVGVTPEVRERMFDPFFTTKPRDYGTGLGLSISHGIVREHHGELSVESEPGQFTRMHVDLPVDNGWKL